MKTLLACTASLMLVGCATNIMKADAATAAVRSALAAQVIDRAGVRGAAPVAGLDGRAARLSQERYEKSFGGKDSGKTYAPDMGTEK